MLKAFVSTQEAQKLRRTTDYSSFSCSFFFFLRFIALLILVFFSPSAVHAGSFINLAFGTNEKLFHAPVSRSALIRGSLKLSADLIRGDGEGEMGKKRKKKKRKKKCKQIEIVLLQKITWPCSARQTLRFISRYRDERSPRGRDGVISDWNHYGGEHSSCALYENTGAIWIKVSPSQNRFVT